MSAIREALVAAGIDPDGYPSTVRWHLGRQRPTTARNRKLTDEQVRAIRQHYDTGGASIRGLAREYGVSRATIRRTIHRETYRDVPDTERIAA